MLRRFSPSVGQVGRPLVFIQLLEGNQQLHSDADIESPCSISNMIVNIRSYVNINIVLYLYGHRFFFLPYRFTVNGLCPVKMGTCLAKSPIDTITRRLRANRERRLAMILTRQTRTHNRAKKNLTWKPSKRNMSLSRNVFSQQDIPSLSLYNIYISPLFDASKPYK